MTTISLLDGPLRGHRTDVFPGQTHLYLLGSDRRGAKLVYRITPSGGRLCFPVATGESCPRCGEDLTLYSSGPRHLYRPDDAYGPIWLAHDGDPVLCLLCDYRSSVAVDEEEAWIR